VKFLLKECAKSVHRHSYATKDKLRCKFVKARRGEHTREPTIVL